ncbi:MAG TPA: riboflavin synthase [Burkholderiales bacterium]|nr:riboflavin synthase [Burkholderiales bacterium]
MFTGIIEAVGTLDAIARRDTGARIRVNAATLDLAGVKVGDSISVNGVCLTVVTLGNRVFEADLSAETLARTTFGRRQAGDRVNLERALTLAKPLGGHLVSGHVDDVARVQAYATDGQARVVTFQVPDTLSRYIAAKGSICVDGVSLTVNGVERERFTVTLIPHTLGATTLDLLQVDAIVNIEVDLVARYLERLLTSSGTRDP